MSVKEERTWDTEKNRNRIKRIKRLTSKEKSPQVTPGVGQGWR